ncbi:MAG: tRNA glutamyl-Q(34) synthetase GluQRS [Idiomarina sp.]|nr:tRNA glutamyl-Q(34) synthetase GluQRS [Idiomarina sp.]
MGRFAPSPSGPLHAGSLLAAVGSYLDAKAHQGQWLLRIENIDPPREVEGSAGIICKQLEAHGLHWDGPILWQSESTQVFQDVLNALEQKQLAYYCTCTRAEIKARGGHYDGHCRTLNRSAHEASARFLNDTPILSYQDRIKGTIEVPSEFASEDFVLRRRDQLWAYQLAVVCDDYLQGVSHIVRGEDLLFPSVWQLSLWQCLSEQRILPPRVLPQLAHLPLLLDPQGQKLSKQNHAPALDETKVRENLYQALVDLKLAPSAQLLEAEIEDMLAFGVGAWSQRYIISN